MSLDNRDVTLSEGVMSLDITEDESKGGEDSNQNATDCDPDCSVLSFNSPGENSVDEPQADVAGQEQPSVSALRLKFERKQLPELKAVEVASRHTIDKEEEEKKIDLEKYSEVESPSLTTAATEKDALTVQTHERASTPPVMDTGKLNEWISPDVVLTELSPIKSFEQREETPAATPTNKGEQDPEIAREEDDVAKGSAAFKTPQTATEDIDDGENTPQTFLSTPSTSPLKEEASPPQLHETSISSRVSADDSEDLKYSINRQIFRASSDRSHLANFTDLTPNTHFEVQDSPGRCVDRQRKTFSSLDYSRVLESSSFKQSDEMGDIAREPDSITDFETLQRSTSDSPARNKEEEAQTSLSRSQNGNSRTIVPSRSSEAGDIMNEKGSCQDDVKNGRRSSAAWGVSARRSQSSFYASKEPETLVDAYRLPQVMKTRKLFGGDFYQNPSECSAVISMVESKRRCWFENELRAIRREWNHYKKWLRDSVREVTRLENLVRCSYEALNEYSKAVCAICADKYVNDEGKLLTNREQNRLEKRRVNDSAETEAGTDSSSLLEPLFESFSMVKEELETQVPPMEKNAEEAAALKREIADKAKELEESGDTIGTSSIEKAEANIQDAYDNLMRAAQFHEQGEYCNESVLDASKDRWLLETLYRNAANAGLLTWKEIRRDYQKLFEEIIQLDEERRNRLKQILLSFLPRRRKLMDTAHGCFAAGVLVFEGGRLSSKEECRNIEKTLERISHSTLERKEDLSLGRSGLTDSLEAFSTDPWDTPYVKERRILQLKVSKEWLVAIGVITVDNYFHAFVLNEEDYNSSEICKMAVNVATESIKVPSAEVFVKLAEFEITMIPGTTEISLMQNGRSKIFRRRDHFYLRFNDEYEAAEYFEMIRISGCDVGSC